jgi:radical SAM protein with 4Fe4S-binding SPASM domain
VSDKADAGAVYFGIEITRRCNLRCPHCFTSSGGAAHAGPSEEALRSLLGDLARAGITSVAFSGGEPLLRHDLGDLIRCGRDLGIEHFAIVTNGFYADSATVRALAQAGLEGVQVSLDGVDAIDHASVRGCERRDFYRALRAVRAFLDAGLSVDVATILSRRNMERAPELAMLCEVLGARALRYCTFVPTGRGADPAIARAYDLEPSQIDAFLDLMRTLNKTPGAPLQIVIDHGIGPWVQGHAFRCVSGAAVAYLSAEGDLYPCPGLVFDEFKVGNVHETPVETLLARPEMAAVRCIPHREIRGICQACSNSACSGGCRGGAYAQTGDIRGAVSYCNYPSGHATSKADR